MIPVRALSLPRVVLLTVLNHLAYTGSRITVSLYAIFLGASPLIVGVLMSLFALLPMLILVHIGRQMDRVGVLRPIAAAAVAVFCGLLLPWFWPGLRGLYLSATAIGTGFAVYFVALNNMVGAIGGPERRAANFSWLALGFSTGGFIGPMLAGFAIDATSHRAAFVVLAAFPAVALMLLLGQRHALPAGHRGRGAAQGGGRLGELLGEPRLRAAFVASLVLATGWDLYTFAMPIYCTRIGLSASTIGVIMATFAAATFAVRLTMPLLARRLREWTVIGAAMQIAGAAYGLFALARTVPSLMGLSFLFGLGLGAAQPMIMSLLYSASPAGREAEVIGVRATALSMSTTVMPLVFGALGAALGMVPVFLAMAAGLFGAAWRARQRMRLGGPAPAARRGAP